MSGVTRVIKIATPKDQVIRRYLQTINGLFKLTPTEMDCLVLMLEIDPNKTATKEIREVLCRRLGKKSVKDIANLVKYLKDKKAIFPDPEKRQYNYNPLVIPQKKITFSFEVIPQQ